MNNTEKIEELKRLYKELIEMLKPYCKPYNAIGVYMDVSENILSYLNNNNDKGDKVILNVWLRVVRGFNRFYEVLQENITDDNYMEKIRNITKEIGKIIQ